MDDSELIQWLTGPDDPAVYHQTMTTLLGRISDDPEVAAARLAAMSTGLIHQIFLTMNADGSWGDPLRFYNDKYTGSVWNLLLLAELGADPADGNVHQACEFILNNSQSPESSGFSYTHSAKTGGGLASGVIPCLTGNMVFSLIRPGYLDDPRVQKAIDWITTWQRADDGESQPPRNANYDRFEMCWGKHSCHMGVAKAFKALAAIPADQRSPSVLAKINELGEYFLKHYLYKRSHDLAEVAKPGWLKPGFPLMYQTDILELLDIFASLGWWDERLRDALEIIKGLQKPDGRWILENSFNGKMLVRIEQKGKPSKWITLRALRVLKAYC
ncbi:MAG TPA: nitrogen fixation protein NifH [Clostridiales bacterium]|nr:nitrogen fixation protein NifH [Clostridiales bacterium]